MSKTASYYHIVFSTKHRENTILANAKEDLYRFIWKELEKINCHLIRIGGTENHVHIFFDLHPSKSLSEVMQIIKSHSSGWANKNPAFPFFKGWTKGYFGCSITPKDRNIIIEYIKSQESHHKVNKFEDEIKSLYTSAGIEFDERDWL